MYMETILTIGVIVGAFILGAIAMCIVGVLLDEVDDE
jgi:uncharacterized membrane protein